MGLEFEIGNDKRLLVNDLANAQSGTAIDDATVTYVITGPTGITLGSGTVASLGSGGDYSVTVESTVTSTFTAGAKHTCAVTIVSGTMNGASSEEFYPTRRRAAT